MDKSTQREIYNMDLSRDDFIFSGYRFSKKGDHFVAIFQGEEETPSVLWRGTATKLNDILSLYSFFDRKLVCLKEDHGEEGYFYRPPGKSGIKFENSWHKTDMALNRISKWTAEKYQTKILAFHYFMAFRSERSEFVKSVLMQTCIKECLKNNLGQKIWKKYFEISKEEYDFLKACWRRLRNCNVHKIQFTRDDFIAEDYFQTLSKRRIDLFREKIGGEKDFRIFIKQCFGTFDMIVAYFFANLFGVYSLDQAPNIQDQHYLQLKNFFDSWRMPEDKE